MSVKGQGAKPGPIILAQSGVSSSVTAGVNKTTLASVNIPGGMMGPNGSLRITFGMTYTGVNAKTVRVELGGSALGSTAPTTQVSGNYTLYIRNKNNSTSLQSGQASLGSPFGSQASASAGSTVNTTVDQLLVISAQPTVDGEAVTLDHYLVEILPS